MNDVASFCVGSERLPLDTGMNFLAAEQLVEFS